MKKQAQWIFDQNSYTFWYKCSNCGYGVFDGWDCNQHRSDNCPKCNAEMTNSERYDEWQSQSS